MNIFSLKKELIYITTMVTLFMVPLQIVLMDNVHYYVLFFCLVFFIVPFRNKKYLNKDIFFLYFGYAFFALFSIALLGSILIPVIGVIELMLPISVWIIYFYNGGKIELGKYLRLILQLNSILAIAGIYQRFYDPTLFGIMNQINKLYTAEMFSNVAVIRISSFLPSTQVFSLLMGMTVCMCFQFYEIINIKSWTFYFMASINAIAGILSGGQTFIVCFIVFITLFLVRRRDKLSTKIKYRFFVLMSFVVTFIIISLNSKSIPKSVNSTIMRIFRLLFNPLDSFSKEQNRLVIMTNVLNGKWYEVVFGRGLGTSTNAAANMLKDSYFVQRYTTESFFFQIWYETGFIGLFLVLVVFWRVVRIIDKGNQLGSELIIAVLVTSIFTHAIVSPVFFFFWGLVAYLYHSSHLRLKNSKVAVDLEAKQKS